MKKQRMPWDIEPSNLLGFTNADAAGVADLIEERFGPPESDEESHLYNTELLGADIDPMAESVQRPKSHG